MVFCVSRWAHRQPKKDVDGRVIVLTLQCVVTTCSAMRYVRRAASMECSGGSLMNFTLHPKRQCIQEWRQGHKSTDEASTTDKSRCPVCREISSYVIPSKKFLKQDNEERWLVAEKFKRDTGKGVCRYVLSYIAHWT